MSQENVEIARALIEAGPQADIDQLRALVHPDVEFFPLRAATEGAYRGYEGVEKFRADNHETFETFEPHYEFRDLGDRVLAWGTIHVRGRGGGVEIDVPTGGIFEFRNGKIFRWEDFGSKEKALKAAGLSE